MKNLGELMDFVYSAVGDPGRTIHSAAFVRSLLNTAQREMAQSTAFYRKSGTMDSVADQQDYELVGQFDAPSKASVSVVTGGSLTALKDYYWKVSLYSSAWDVETALSPISTKVVTTVDEKTGRITFPTGNDSMWDYCRVWRAKAVALGGDAPTAFYYVGQALLSDLTYDDGAADTALVDLYDTRTRKLTTNFEKVMDVWYDTDYHLKPAITYPLPTDLDHTGTPLRYGVYNNTLQLRPIPDESGKEILIFYRATPPELSDDGDVPELSEVYRMGMVYYTLWWTFMHTDVERAFLYKRLYEEQVIAVKNGMTQQDDIHQVDNWLL